MNATGTIRQRASIDSGRSSPWIVWLEWTVATTAGVVIGQAALFLFGWSMLMRRGDVGGIWPPLLLAGAAIPAGVAQWLVLRRRLPEAWWWLPTLPVAWALAGAAVLAAGVPLGSAVGVMSFGGAAGLVAGVLQWLLLRRHWTEAGWWVVGSAAAWLIGNMLGPGLATGFAAGAITGIAMGWGLAAPPRPDERTLSFRDALAGALVALTGLGARRLGRLRRTRRV